MLEYLENPDVIPVEVEITIQRGNQSVCNNGYCYWTSPSNVYDDKTLLLT